MDQGPRDHLPLTNTATDSYIASYHETKISIIAALVVSVVTLLFAGGLLLSHGVDTNRTKTAHAPSTEVLVYRAPTDSDSAY
jgi:hypothetical protein